VEWIRRFVHLETTADSGRVIVHAVSPAASVARATASAFREYLEPTTPLSRAKMTLGYFILAVAFVMGPIALVIQPIPLRIAAIYAMFGATIGVLYVTGLMLLRIIGLSMFMLYLHSVMAYAQARSADGNVSDFTGECIVVSVWMLVGVGPHILCRAREPLRRRQREAAAR
jgi:hypothetical protein